MPSNLSFLNKATMERIQKQVDVDTYKPPPPLSPAELMKDVVVPVAGGTEITLPWRVFKEPLRVDMLHAYIKWQRANKRQLGNPTKTRSEIRGSSRKLRPQKGLGKARVGSIRSPIRRGGSKAHGPKKRSFKQDLNVPMRKMALRVALSLKLREDNLIVVQDFGGTEGKTKNLARRFQHLLPAILFVYHAEDELFLRSARNIPNVDVRRAPYLDVYTILRRQKLVLTVDAVEELIRRLHPQVSPLPRFAHSKIPMEKAKAMARGELSQ